MRATPLLKSYWSELHQRDFHSAKHLLDEIERRHWRDDGFGELIALERERLEHNGLQLLPRHHSNRKPRSHRPDANGIALERIGADHDWYLNAELERILRCSWGGDPALRVPAELDSVLVLANNFSLSTGVLRPLSHHLNYLHHHGGPRLRSVQLQDDASAEVIDDLLSDNDLVIVNGLQQICNVDQLAAAVARRARRGPVLGYLHETRWILDRLPEIQKRRVRAILPHMHLLLCCERQRQDFAPYGRGLSASVVHNPTLSAGGDDGKPPPRRVHGSVLMSGTIQERKGIAFFNHCAESLQAGGYSFSWAGQARDPGETLSESVCFLGHLSAAELQRRLLQTDIFFLSSLEDTFPLAAIEAYLHGCKLLLPRSTGLVDVLEGRSAVHIYESHSLEAARQGLDQLRDSPAPSAGDRLAISRELGLQSFLERMNGAISLAVSPPSEAPSVAVIAHLYYTDLGFELARHLQAVAGPRCDLYLTVPRQKSDPQLMRSLQEMFSPHFRTVHCLEVENRGMDIAPFFSAITALQRSSQPTPDLILKIHMKKSLQNSGSRKGQRWRRGLLEGLLGNRCNVRRIQQRFVSDQELTLLAPASFLMLRSSQDRRIAANDQLVNDLLRQYDLPADPQRPFVRGTMFWVRGAVLLQELKRCPLPPAEMFNPGHCPDGSLAHAYERVLSYLPQRHHAITPDQPSEEL